jgi:hypothetical protein
MKRIGVKTTFVFTNGKFEQHYLKVVTIVVKKITLVFKESLESGLDSQELYVAEKYDTEDDAIDGHDRWVKRAETNDIPFKQSTEIQN